jgi:hypothetical protein
MNTNKNIIDLSDTNLFNVLLILFEEFDVELLLSDDLSWSLYNV